MKGVDILMPKHKLAVIDGETLMDTRLEPIRFCVDTLLVDGLHEAIVPEELWNQAQAKLLSQSKKYEPGIPHSPADRYC